MTLTPNLIACLAIGGAGILTALLSIPFFRHTGMLRRKCSARHHRHRSSLPPATQGQRLWYIDRTGGGISGGR